MKVRELIDKLKGLDPEMKVRVRSKTYAFLTRVTVESIPYKDSQLSLRDQLDRKNYKNEVVLY